MKVFTYDGSFDGLMTAVHEAYYSGQKPDKILSEKGLQINLLEEYRSIVSEPDKARKVVEAIRKKISPDALKKVYHVHLSEDSEAGTYVYHYLRLGFKVGRKVDDYLSDDRVMKVHMLSRRVAHEVHILSGFLRFRLLEGGIYYAPVKPDYNIVELLAPHFAERFSGQHWVIHDVGRRIAALHDGNRWVLMDADVEQELSPDPQEKDYQLLWKEFFRSIAIRGRINPRLQKRLMPVRYWKHLTEMQD